MMHRSLVLAATLLACSDGTSPTDAGTSDVVTQDATPIDATPDATPDGPAPSVPEALDQAGKLALWLEATSADLVLGDGGGVTAWKDKSKNHNDASAPGTSPSVQASAIGAHDAVHFALYTDTLSVADAASLRFATDPIYITAVAKVLTYRAFFFGKFGGTNLDGLSFFTAPSGTTTDAGVGIPTLYVWFDNTGDQTTWSGVELGDGKFHIVSFRRKDATNVELALDDLAPQAHVLGAHDVSAQGQPLQIGPIGGPTQPDFSLVEELAVHSATDADAASVHAYLKQKYGL